MMKLFHGSNVQIDEIDLSKSNKGKDFGCGFYLNPNETQAREMAMAKADFLGGKPYVSVFEFELNALSDGELKVKTFDDYNLEWAEFVVLNRRNFSTEQAHDYDIVIGPIADDKVGVQIRRFMNGYLSPSDLIEELRFKNPSIQYFFGSEKALKYLKLIR